jgi:hypothetical protein
MTISNQSLAVNYLSSETGLVWNIVQTFNVSCLEEIDNDFWTRPFYEIEQHHQRVDQIRASHVKWFKDISARLLDFEFDHLIQPDAIGKLGTIGTLYGARIYVDETIPKHLAIICSECDFQKAVVLVNNNWLEKAEEQIILPKISKFQWMQKQAEKEELILTN